MSTLATEDPELTVTLPRSLWLATAELLGRLPYGDVAGVLETIAEQIGPQLRDLDQSAQEQGAEAASVN